MNQLLLAAVLGLGAGGLYAIMGAGIVVGFKGSGVINFAHGAFATFGAFAYSELRTEGAAYLPWFDFIPGPIDVPTRIDLTSSGGTSMGVAIIGGLLMSALVGVLAHALVFHPLRFHTAVAKVIGSVGALIYLHAVLAEHYGTGNRIGDGVLPETPLRNVFWLGGNVGVDKFLLAGAGLAVGLLISVFYRVTRIGLATRAADDNEKGLSLLGYSPSFLALTNWMFAAFLAGLGGILFLGSVSLTPVAFTLFIVPALGAALVGNLSSPVMAALGGLALGVAQSSSVALSHFDWFPAALPPAAMRQVIPFAVIVFTLYRRGERLPSRGSWSDHGQPITIPTGRPLLIGVLVLVGGLIVIPGLSSRWDLALANSLITMILMMSLVVLVGFLGQVSLVHVSLAGTAAYSAVRFASDGTREVDFIPAVVAGPGLPDVVAFVLGVSVAVLVGLLIAIPALRIRGVHLAVVTLAAALTIEQVFLTNETLVGAGARSNTPVPRPSWFGVDLGPQDRTSFLFDRWQFTYFVLVLTVLVAIAVVNLRRGQVGRQLLATRGNERAAEAAGIDVTQIKLLGFGISSAIAGIAGVLIAYQRTVLQVTSFDELAGLGSLAFVYLGGITSVAGALLGSFVVAGGVVPTLLKGGGGTSPSFIANAMAGALLILIAVLYPDGLAAAIRRGASRLGGAVTKQFSRLAAAARRS
jgi:branched-chain amino acid transport system permease protein